MATVTRVIKPPAAFTPRNSRERRVTLDNAGFPYDQLKELACFAKATPDLLRSLSNFPDAMIVRFYQRGEPICHQDDPGFTAFYILKKAEIDRLSQAGRLQPIADASPWPASAVLSVRKQFYESNRSSDPVYLSEGEIFGEMSCLARIPRTATVTAECDCYVLELMSNVFTQGRLKAQVEDKVVARILELHLRGIELFNSDNLDEAKYAAIIAKLKERLGLAPSAAPAPAAKAEKYEFLQQRRHDHVLFAENDRPDGLYIIRLGMVKVVKGASPLVGPEDVLDWSAVEAKLRGPEQTGPLRELANFVPAALWTRLDEARSASASDAWLPEQQEILYALNDLLKRKDFVASIKFAFNADNPLQAAMEQESRTLKDGKSFDEIVRLRTFNRRLLEMLLGGALKAFGARPPHTLAIRSSREWTFAAHDPTMTAAESALIGEMGLFENKPRSATCIAYCHPEAKFGETHLFYIPKDLFADLLDPGHVAEVITRRKEAELSRQRLSIWQESANTQRFEELGLMQGQKLMLIDLDRCTRCDKCVEACVATHSPPGWLGRLVEHFLPASLRNTGPRDGRSRLFLDGPRIQVHDGERTRSYLVPATCRQCKDPVCLVGCPVGAIHKGTNGQIVIENWCIGCTKCATSCPYNSIQMHPVGVVPRSSAGWRVRQGARSPRGGVAPFRFNREFLEVNPDADPFEFALHFELTAEHAKKSKAFLLHVESAAAKLQAVVNGQPVEIRKLDAKEIGQKPWNWEVMLGLVGQPELALVPGASERAPTPCLRLGDNDLVVVIAPGDASKGAVLLDAGLTGYAPPVVANTGDDAVKYEQEWVAQNAVVCDQCSGQMLQKPACVTACPHEAAERHYITYDSFLPPPSTVRA